MKIFISHSSRDKWAARRISDDLISFGAATFLDEKDIRTGQSIDESIGKHLKECDDFLILVTPASLKSDWVLIELGGAIALEKTIIPILLYVGANELPQIINLRLSRDINNIDEYYLEVKKKIEGKPINKKEIKQAVGGFSEGDTVRVTSIPPDDFMKGGFTLDWEPEMDKFLGITTTVKSVYLDEVYTLVGCENKGGGHFLFAEEWLNET